MAVALLRELNDGREPYALSVAPMACALAKLGFVRTHTVKAGGVNLVKLPRGRYCVEIADYKRCGECGGPIVATLNVRDSSGWSAGSAVEHAPECSELRCPHGVLWENWAGCKACENEDEEREADIAKDVHNSCEHGDHAAPAGNRFCSKACMDCEASEQVSDHGCNNICGLGGSDEHE